MKKIIKTGTVNGKLSVMYINENGALMNDTIDLGEKPGSLYDNELRVILSLLPVIYLSKDETSFGWHMMCGHYEVRIEGEQTVDRYPTGIKGGIDEPEYEYDVKKWITLIEIVDGEKDMELSIYQREWFEKEIIDHKV